MMLQEIFQNLKNKLKWIRLKIKMVFHLKVKNDYSLPRLDVRFDWKLVKLKT
jgi:hypothetical protein